MDSTAQDSTATEAQHRHARESPPLNKQRTQRTTGMGWVGPDRKSVRNATTPWRANESALRHGCQNRALGRKAAAASCHPSYWCFVNSCRIDSGIQRVTYALDPHPTALSCYRRVRKTILREDAFSLSAEARELLG